MRVDRNFVVLAAVLVWSFAARAGQAPGSASAPDLPISHRDRVYAAEQFSNTISVSDPTGPRLLGVIRLGEPSPANFSPLYRGQVLVHGMGFSPDHRTLAVVSIGSNSVTFIDTASNAVKHTTYLGRSPHEAFFTPDGKEVWVTVRGEDYVSVIDAATYEEKARIATPNGPGMQIFSPDGTYGYVCSSFDPETVVVEVATRTIVGRVKQESPFCPNIAATPDGTQVWLTLKDTGRTMVFDAKPPFAVIRSIDTGPITNHVNFARTGEGNVRLRHGGRTESREGVPHGRFLAGRLDRGGEAAARGVAFGRRHARLRRARERRPARRDRHRDQRRGGPVADRSGAAGARLRERCRSGRRRAAGAGARSAWRGRWLD